MRRSVSLVVVGLCLVLGVPAAAGEAPADRLDGTTSATRIVRYDIRASGRVTHRQNEPERMTDYTQVWSGTWRNVAFRLTRFGSAFVLNPRNTSRPVRGAMRATDTYAYSDQRLEVNCAGSIQHAPYPAELLARAARGRGGSRMSFLAQLTLGGGQSLEDRRRQEQEAACRNPRGDAFTPLAPFSIVPFTLRNGIRVSPHPGLLAVSFDRLSSRRGHFPVPNLGRGRGFRLDTGLHRSTSGQYAIEERYSVRFSR